MSHPSSASHRTPRWLIGCAGGLAVAATLWIYTRADSAHAQKPAAGGGAVPVTAGVAVAQDVEIPLTALGTVTPVSSVAITSRVGGILQQVHYQEGQVVKAGTLLAQIDPRPYEAAVTQAKGQLARDQALLANAQIDFDRYQTAFKKQAIAEQQVATQQAAVQGDKGLVQLDEGSLEAAQVNLDYTRITSPITGRVGLRQIDAGNIVQANGSTPLVTITQLQPITVVFTLSQDLLAQVQHGIHAGTPLKVEAFDRAKQQPIATGELLTIDNQIDSATGSFRLKAQFANADDALWPGQFVSVRLVTSVDRHAVTIPARAIQAGPNGSYLYVIKPGNTVEMRTVEVTQVEHGVAAVAKGLAAGERVVLDGQYRLEQGTHIALAQ